MNWLLTFILSLNLITLIGCAVPSQAPIPLAHPKAWQRKMQAAHHWSLLAEYQAGRIIKAINDASKPIYIQTPADMETSPFAQAYHDMLQSHLVKKGAVVVTEQVQGGVMASYTAQIVKHQDRPYVVLEPGILAAPPPRPVLEIPSWNYHRVDNTEVIITTKVVEGMLVLHSSSDIYYFNAGDSSHYGPYPIAKNATFKVVDGTENNNDGL